MCPIRSQSFKAYLHICQDAVLRRRPGNRALNFPPNLTHTHTPKSQTSHNSPSVGAKRPISPKTLKKNPNRRPGRFYIYRCLSPALIFGCSEAGGSRHLPPGLRLEKDLLPSPRIMSSASCVGEHLLNPGCLMLNCQ